MGSFAAHGGTSAAGADASLKVGSTEESLVRGLRSREGQSNFPFGLSLACAEPVEASKTERNQYPSWFDASASSAQARLTTNGQLFLEQTLEPTHSQPSLLDEAWLRFRC